MFVTLLALILIMVLGSTEAVDSKTLVSVTILIVVIAAAVAWWVGSQQSAAVAAEKAAGYSTLYDFEGFELRHHRTGAVIRPRDVPPGGGIRRSLVSGMLTVPAGSPLARRLADEAGRAASDTGDGPTTR